MAPCEVTDDYYDILEISQTATLEIIRKSYRRLAIARHPDKNPNKPDATAAFQSLARAYETIIDPEKRRAYDQIWINIVHRRKAAETEQKRAAAEALHKQKHKQKQQRESQARLQELEQSRSTHDNHMFEINRQIRRLKAELKRLQDQDDEESRKERERNSWFTYFTSPFYGKAEETQEQKQQRDAERLQRLASRSIKGNELSRLEVRHQALQSALDGICSKIVTEKQRIDNEARAQEARRQERLRREQEAKRQAETERQARERQAMWETVQAELRRAEAERAAKRAEEARIAQEARQAQARTQAEAARQRAKKPEFRTTSTNNYQRASTLNSDKATSCKHHIFWPQLQGTHLWRELSGCSKTLRFPVSGMQDDRLRKLPAGFKK